MLKNFLLVAMTTVFAWTGSVFADTLSGTIHHKDGSKVKKTAKITNSWNSDHAKYPADGEYKIDFKGKVGKKVTIYVNGDKYTEIEVKGDTKLKKYLTVSARTHFDQRAKTKSGTQYGPVPTDYWLQRRRTRTRIARSLVR